MSKPAAPSAPAPEPDRGEGHFIPGEGASGLLIERREMFDRVLDVGRQLMGMDVVTVRLPRAEPGLPDEVQALVKLTPAGPVLEPLKPLFEPWRTAPERRRGTATATTLASFVALVNRHKDAGSVVFAKTDWPSPALTAVIDYHGDASTVEADALARFGEHRVRYAFPLTDAFKEWMGADGVAMEQHDFALFLEDHVDDLTAPMDTERTEYERLFKEKIALPNQLVDLSRSLEIFVGTKVKRQERLQTGERTVLFETEHSNGRGEPVDIPGIFMIALAAFVDGEPIRLPARLRYRLKGGEILWFFNLYRPERWLRAQVQNDLDTVARDTLLPCFEGEPETGRP